MLASSRKPWVAGKTRADGAPTLGCLLTCFRIHFGVWCLKKIDSLLRKKVYYKKQSSLGMEPAGAGDAPAAYAVMVPAVLGVSCCRCSVCRDPWVPRVPRGCPPPATPGARARGPAHLTSCYNVGDLALIPALGTCPGEGNGCPLQHSCWENRMDRGAS